MLFRSRLKTLPDGSALIWAGKEKPDYLVRDLEIIDHAWKAYLHYIGEAFENEKSARTVKKAGYGGEDVATSGFDRLLLREPMKANIVATALDCQTVHKRLLVMADRMINDGRRESEISVVYDLDYDLTPLSNLLDDCKKLITESEIPSTRVKKEMHKRIATRVVGEPDKLEEAYGEIEAADYGVNDERELMAEENARLAGTLNRFKASGKITDADMIDIDEK